MENEKLMVRPMLMDVKEGKGRHYDMTVAMLNKSMGLCLR